MTESAAPAVPATPPSSPTPPRRWRRMALAVAAALAGLGGTAVWLVGSESGLRAALALAETASGGRVRAEGVQGRLWDELSIARLDIDAGPTGPRIRIDDAALAWTPAALLSGRLDIARLAAARVQIASAPSDEPATPPADLRLPLAVRIGDARVDQLILRTLPAPQGAADGQPANGAVPDLDALPETLRLAALAARLESDGRHHRLDGLAATWEKIRLSGEARLDGAALDGAEAVLASLQASGSAEGRDFQVEAQAKGPLAALQINAQASAAAPAAAQAVPDTSQTNGQTAKSGHGQATATTRTAKPAAAPLRGTLAATLAPFAPWPVPAAQARIAGLDPAAWATGAPQASLDLELRVSSEAGEGGAPHARLDVANARPGPLDQDRLPLAGLTLTVRPEAAQATSATPTTKSAGTAPAKPSDRAAASPLPPLLLSLDARLADGGAEKRMKGTPGTLHGQGTLRDGTLAATLTLAGVNAQTLHRGAQATRVDGTLAVTADAARQRLKAALENRLAPRVTLDADLTREGPRLTLHQARLGEAGAKEALLEASGSLDLGASNTTSATTAFTVDGRTRGLDLSRFVKAPPTHLSATLKASGQLGSGPALPRVDLAYRLADSRINGQPAAGEGRLSLAGTRLMDADLGLDLGGNTLAAKGRFGASGDRLAFTLAAPHLDPVLGALGLSGSLAAQGELTGTLADPGGRLTLATPRLGLPGGIAVNGLEARLALGPGPDGEASARVQLKRLTQGSAALARDADLQVAGSKRRQDWTLRATLAEDQGLARTLALSASGGLAAPDKHGAGRQGQDGPRWVGRLTALELGGDVPLRLAQPASLDLSAQRVLLADARIQGGGQDSPWRLAIDTLDWQAASATGNGRSNGRATPPRLVTRGELRGLPVRLFLPEAGRASTLTLGGRWSLDLGENANGEASLGREQGDLLFGERGAQSQSLGLTALALNVRLDQGRARLALEARGARLGTLAGDVRAQLLRGPDASGQNSPNNPPGLAGWTLARQALLAGDVRLEMPDLAWLGPVAYPGLATGGALSARLQLAGSAAAPLLTGEARGDKLGLRLADLGLNLANGTLDARLAEGHLRLTRLHFDSLPGETPREVRLKELFDNRPGAVDVSGDLDLKAGASSVAWSLDRFTPLQRRNRWLMASGRGQVRVADNRLEVAGEIKADGAFLGLPDLGAPSLPDDVVIKGKEAPPDARLRLTHLDLGLNLGPRFFFKGAGLESRLAGELRLTTRDDGALRANGTIRTADGIFDAYGTRLAIERGIVSFQGPPARPSLNIRALRRGLPVEAGVDVTGTVDRPLVKLVSVPEVPEAEKLSWMVLGKGPGEAGGADPGLLLSAASALFGSEDSTTKRIQEAFGIDEISFRDGTLDGSGGPTATSRVAGGQGFSGSGTGSSTSGSQVLTVGKRISANATLAYEQSMSSVAAQAGSVIRLTVELTRRLSVVARAGTDNALDLQYTFSFGRSSKAQARQDARAAREAGATPAPATP
ncbi:translocation/assembly module TamB domain-containing protein [Oryzomicrobium sp.]|uniref:translocation/assembly module TamB domain-containing protein n=1 Tax=Oryzomicrobium sp. TaxID=1911578 RepID=UPI002FDFB2F5